LQTRILKSDILLFLAATIWGFAFVAQRIGMEYLGPFVFNGIRFGLGSLTLLPFVLWSHRKRAVPQAELKSHLGWKLLAGVVLWLAATLQQIGVVYTTAGKAGFITGLYVVIVPLLGLLLREQVRRHQWLAVFLAASGMYLLSVRNGFRIQIGDLLVFIAAIFWAAHVHFIGWLSPRSNPFRLAALQYAVVSLLSLLLGLIFEEFHLPAIRQALWPILYGGVMSVGIGFTMQVVAQREAPPTHVAILLSLETVVAVFGGWLLLSEVLSARELLGCALVLAAMLTAQLQRAKGS